MSCGVLLLSFHISVCSHVEYERELTSDASFQLLLSLRLDSSPSET